MPKLQRLNLLRKARRRKAKSLVLVSDAYEANQSLVKKRWRAKSNASLVGRNEKENSPTLALLI